MAIPSFRKSPLASATPRECCTWTRLFLMDVVMPILPAETSVFPDDLLTLPDRASPLDGAWRVLHTKPRQEKSLARDLIVREVPFYLPLFAQQRRIRGRVFTALLPLFDGYLFLHGDQDAYYSALATQR